MLPFALVFGFDFGALCAGDVLPQLEGTKVVWPLKDALCAFFVFDIAVFGTALVTIFVSQDSRLMRGGEGERPAEGAIRPAAGSFRFSRGFRNMCREK